MIEKIILDFLTERLSFPVFMEVPKQPTPERYVVIEKTGSSKINHIPTANIAVQSCAGTLLRAAELNEIVKSEMEDINTLTAVGGCRLDTDYNFTDTSTKTYRYQAIFRITYMEA